MGNTGNQGTKSRSILDLSAQEKVAFLKSFDLILSDCDGVIWMLDDSIPQTGAAIELLKNAGKSVKFISNNSLRSDEEYVEKLKVIGVNDVKEDDIVHPVKSLSNYIIKNFKDKPIFSLCSEQMNETFRKNGVIVKTLEVKEKNLTGSNIAENVLPKDKVAAVVLDIKFNMTYPELAMAERYLTNDGDCQFLVGASDGVIPVAKDCTILGCAGFVKLLQDASGKEPIVMGKPGERLNEFLVEKYNIKSPERVLFIGDNLDTDIKFGKQSGFKTMLVLSGATKLEQLQKLPAEEKPNYYADSLGDFIEFFKDTTQSKL